MRQLCKYKFERQKPIKLLSQRSTFRRCGIVGSMIPGSNIPSSILPEPDEANYHCARLLTEYLIEKDYKGSWYVSCYNPVWGWDQHTVGWVDSRGWSTHAFRYKGRNIVMGISYNSRP